MIEITEFAASFNEKLLVEFDKIKDKTPEKVYSAMRYLVKNGGKRVRPYLMYISSELCGVDFERLLPIAFALEYIHTYSLIHDDLPCMDNGDYRRGELCCHKIYGEWLAMLAGDGLLNLAFETALSYAEKDFALTPCISYLAKCSGSRGMVGGQALDLADVLKPIEVSLLKTSALIRAAVVIPYFLSENKTQELFDDLEKVGDDLGLIFQATDDVIDFYDGEDPKNFVKVFTVVGAREYSLYYLKDCFRILSKYGENGNNFYLFCKKISERKK